MTGCITYHEPARVGVEDLPVGAPELICTTSAALVTDVAPAPWYSVVLSVPLSDTHSGDPGA